MARHANEGQEERSEREEAGKEIGQRGLQNALGGERDSIPRDIRPNGLDEGAAKIVCRLATPFRLLSV